MRLRSPVQVTNAHFSTQQLLQYAGSGSVSGSGSGSRLEFRLRSGSGFLLRLHRALQFTYAANSICRMRATPLSGRHSMTRIGPKPASPNPVADPIPSDNTGRAPDAIVPRPPAVILSHLQVLQDGRRRQLRMARVRGLLATLDRLDARHKPDDILRETTSLPPSSVLGTSFAVQFALTSELRIAGQSKKL